jgi:hypothetical protein
MLACCWNVNFPCVIVIAIPTTLGLMKKSLPLLEALNLHHSSSLMAQSLISQEDTIWPEKLLAWDGIVHQTAH